MYLLDVTHGTYVRVSDGAVIPDDMGNTDRLAVQAWLDAGNVADPMPGPVFDPAAAMARLRTKRDALLDVADRAQLRLITKLGDMAGATVLEDCKQALRDLPVDSDVVAALANPGSTDATFDRLVLLKYRQIVGPVPATVVDLFVKVATA